MASTVDVQKILSMEKFELIVHEPGDADLNAVKYVDLKDFDSFVAGYLRTAGTDVLDNFQISAAQDASGTNKQVIKTSTAQPDAVGDQAYIEIASQEVEQVGVDAGITDLRFVTLEVENATAGDQAAVTYVLGRAHFPGKDLTADVIA